MDVVLFLQIPIEIRPFGIKLLAGGTVHLSCKKFNRDLKEQCHKYKVEAKISVTKSILEYRKVLKHIPVMIYSEYVNAYECLVALFMVNYFEILLEELQLIDHSKELYHQLQQFKKNVLLCLFLYCMHFLSFGLILC